MQGLTRRDGFFENRDELHSFPRLPLFSPTLSVAAQRPQRIIFLPRSSVVVRHRTGSVGDTGGGGSAYFHSDVAGNVDSVGAESRLVASPPPVRILCYREGKGCALLSRGGISRSDAKNVLPSGTAGHHIILSQYTEISFHVIFHTWCNSN